jgi:tetratricopeptide (TPR) repeat protein
LQFSYVRCLSNCAIAVIFSLCLSACHRAPDDSYLQDLKHATDLLDAYAGKGDDLDLAAALLGHMIERRPDLPHAFVEQSRLEIKRGHLISNEFRTGTLEKAQSKLDTAISLDADYCDAYVYLGYLQYLKKQYAEALTALDRADTLACATPWRILNRNSVYMALQRYDDAKLLLDQVPVATIESPASTRMVYHNVLTSKIWLAYSQGDQPSMLMAIHEMIALTPADHAWGIGDAAANLVQAGAFEEAVSTARKALQRMRYGAAEHTLGVALYGASLWHSSHLLMAHPDASPAQEWDEAESLASFDDAANLLWGSLANRDIPFRTLLQDRMLKARAEHEREEHSAGK